MVLTPNNVTTGARIKTALLLDTVELEVEFR